MPARRSFLAQGGHTCAAAMAAATLPIAVAEGMSNPEPAQRFLLIGLVGSKNPTRANFPFAWANALKDAGHEVRIELAGDATVLMRTVVADHLMPVGLPPFRETLAAAIAHGIPIYV
jgi:hypothetical protein